MTATRRYGKTIRPFIAVCVAMFILLAQQAAFRHVLSHLSSPVQYGGQAVLLADAGLPADTLFPNGHHSDSSPGSALDHECLECLAFAGAGSAPPASGMPLFEPADVAAPAWPELPQRAGGASVLAYRARAPPSPSSFLSA